jgi:hypothetical protein
MLIGTGIIISIMALVITNNKVLVEAGLPISEQ